MGFGNLQFWTQTPLDKHTYLAAEEVNSEFHTKGDLGPKYRRHLLVEYRELEGCPPKRDENGHLRSSKQAQLDRAWTKVAKRFDRTEQDIRGCVMKIYDDVDLEAARKRAEEAEDDETLAEIKKYDQMPKTAWLREEFDEILELAAENRKEKESDED
jgi:hypothetical protein